MDSTLSRTYLGYYCIVW